MSTETYTRGDAANAVDFMARRTAETHAAFMLSLLQLESKERSGAARTFRAGATDPDARFAQAWFEAVGWKE